MNHQDPQDAWATLATAVEGAADLLDGREGPAPPLPHLTDSARRAVAGHLRRTLREVEPAILPAGRETVTVVTV